MRIAKTATIFTLLSLGLGAGTILSPRVAALGWLIGTLLSLVGGLAYGVGAESRGEAARGGGIVGGVPIFIGCGLAAVFGPVPLMGVVMAVVVGTIAGALGAILGRTVSNRSAFAGGSR